MLRWEQAWLDATLSDVFGFHALQLGLPEMDGLRTNRMPHRWLACESQGATLPIVVAPAADATASVLPVGPAALRCQPEALPFPDQSLDLVLLPHTLELALDPHLALAEAARVLRPEGRLVVTGVNPVSLWIARQKAGRLRRHAGLGGGPLFLPPAGEAIGYWRLRDWLRLLHIEPEQARFGCYRWPCRSERWLDRVAWMESIGERWWPVFGAVYMLQAVKRVRGVRLVGLQPAAPGRLSPTPAALTRHRLPPGPTCRDNARHE